MMFSVILAIHQATLINQSHVFSEVFDMYIIFQIDRTSAKKVNLQEDTSVRTGGLGQSSCIWTVTLSKNINFRWGKAKCELVYKLSADEGCVHATCDIHDKIQQTHLFNDEKKTSICEFLDYFAFFQAIFDVE